MLNCNRKPAGHGFHAVLQAAGCHKGNVSPRGFAGRSVLLQRKTSLGK